MQTASSRFWTQVTGFISYVDNHYTMYAFVCMQLYGFKQLIIIFGE